MSNLDYVKFGFVLYVVIDNNCTSNALRLTTASTAAVLTNLILELLGHLKVAEVTFTVELPPS